MPYIEYRDKEKWLGTVLSVPNMTEIKKGELTYILFKLAVKYIIDKGESYTNISCAVSCLDDAKEEIRRRLLNPYEDKMIIKNGDVI